MLSSGVGSCASLKNQVLNSCPLALVGDAGNEAGAAVRSRAEYRREGTARGGDRGSQSCPPSTCHAQCHLSPEPALRAQVDPAPGQTGSHLEGLTPKRASEPLHLVERVAVSKEGRVRILQGGMGGICVSCVCPALFLFKMKKLKSSDWEGSAKPVLIK